MKNNILKTIIIFFDGFESFELFTIVRYCDQWWIDIFNFQWGDNDYSLFYLENGYHGCKFDFLFLRTFYLKWKNR